MTLPRSSRIRRRESLVISTAVPVIGAVRVALRLPDPAKFGAPS
jgi:hypothetical protein